MRSLRKTWVRMAIVVPLLTAIGFAAWYGCNWLVTRELSLIGLVDIGDAEGVDWVLRWHPERIEDSESVKSIDWDYAGFDTEETRPTMVSAKSTPFELALVKDGTEIVSILMAHGARPEHFAAIEETALHLSPSAKMVDLLVEAGLDVNARDGRGQTPLHWANNGSVVEALIRKGANCMARDFSKQTPLHTVASPSAVKALIKAGADPNAIDDEGYCPIHYTIRYSSLSPNRIRSLYSRTKVLADAGADLDAVTKTGRTPLMMTVPEEDMGRVNPSTEKIAAQTKTTIFLIQRGADFHKRGFLFANYQRPWLFREMVEAGIDMDRLNDEKLRGARQDAVLFAIQWRCTDSFMYLVEHGLDIAVPKERLKETYLRSAAPDGSESDRQVSFFIRLGLLDLLDENEVLNIRRSRGIWMPLSCMALIDARLPPLKSEYDRHPPDDRAPWAEHYAWAKREDLLKGYGLTSSYQKSFPLHGAVLRGDMARVKQLLSDGTHSIDARDEDGRTPLHVACRWERDGLVRVLLDHGAQTNTLDKSPETPLIAAVRIGNAQIVKKLLYARANPSISGIRRFSPLHWLVTRYNPEEEYGETGEDGGESEPTPLEQIYSLLKKRGADLNATDQDGNTPLHLSAHKNAYWIAARLIQDGAKLTVRNKDGELPTDLAEEDNLIHDFLAEKMEKSLRKGKSGPRP